jgi:pimeloyl-ACP methyl ester carboxylesterase
MSEMGTAYSKGIRLYYETFGEGSPLLLVSGWGSSGLSWELAFIDALAKTHRVIVLDNRGTGRSDKPDMEYSIPLMADDCVSVLNAVGVKKVHVLGVSMGGLIAQELALTHNDRVSSLLLCCTSCGWKERITSPQRAFARLFLKPEERLRLRMEMLYTKDFISKEWPHLKEHWKQVARYPTPMYAYRRQLEALMNYSCCDRLAEIRVPTLVMGGDADRLNPVERLKELADGIPGAELQIYPGLGHGFIVEAREDVMKCVLSFLDGKG